MKLYTSWQDSVLFDPVTLTAIGIGVGALSGAGTLAATLLTPKPAAPSMPSPSAPSQSPTGTPDTNKSASGPSFLAAAAAPQQGQTANKGLLGQ